MRTALDELLSVDVDAPGALRDLVEHAETIAAAWQPACGNLSCPVCGLAALVSYQWRVRHETDVPARARPVLRAALSGDPNTQRS